MKNGRSRPFPDSAEVKIVILRAQTKPSMIRCTPASGTFGALILERTLTNGSIVLSSQLRRLSIFGWSALGYTALVILFGAVVRITGSGAGCGQHWPSCQGDIVHLPRSIETAIELTHRLTSALSFAVVVGLWFAVHRIVPPGHIARRAAWAALITMIVEVLVGAALVLLALVGNNDSIARALVMAAHLVNTFLLTASLSLVAWSASRPSIRLRQQHHAALFATVSVALLAVSVTGAVTALGDTVRPQALSGSLLNRLQSSWDVAAHSLDRLRALHPTLATGASVLLLVAGSRLAEAFRGGHTERLLYSCMALVLIQGVAGILNIWLSAPGWLQTLHLALALSLWALWILAWASAPRRQAKSP